MEYEIDLITLGYGKKKKIKQDRLKEKTETQNKAEK
jgi:hypothetical protein